MGQPKVIEYNCRFGDPETQPIMMRLESDLFDLCQATTDKNLSNYEARWCDEVALGVVLASSGYPGKYAKGEIIKGLNDIEDSNCKVFHAGTKIVNENIVTNGGRVLCVTALGNSTRIARENTYKAIEKISWEGMQYRKDIGYRAIKREECDQTT
jgi:phosphoribosylamine--glycine ligase